MAVDNKGGSDLDVFEGLGKKSAARPSQTPPVVQGPTPSNGPAARSSNGPPPPPPSLRSGENGARSAGGPTSPGTLPPPTQRGVAPPPPPGRGALPAVGSGLPSGAPPAGQPQSQPRTPAAATAPAASSSTTKPSANAAGQVDMDWDDDEEATHIFDKDNDPPKTESVAQPAPQSRALPPPVSRPPPVSHPPPPGIKQTLLGVAAPPPPPPPSMNPTPSPFRAQTPIPPPPSSVGGAFARASSVAASTPGPVAYPPPPSMDRPAPHSTLPSHGNQATTLPPQQTTVPMAMPPRSIPSQALPPPPGPSSYGNYAGSAPPPPAPSYRPPPPTGQMTATPSDAREAPAYPPMTNRMEATALVRPPEQSRTVYALFGMVGVLMVAFAIFFMMPHTGQVAVNVADSKGGAVAHLEIYIDGKKQCESAPCIIPDMSSGSHTVKVEAPGYDQPADKAVAVESRKDVTVDFSLTPLQTASTGIKVTGTQPGAHLFVDDRDIGALPQELKELQPGSHRIKIAFGDRYAPVEKTITIGKDEFQDLGNTTLKVIKGKATISLGTPGAKVFMVSGSDRRELISLPISVDIDTSKQWSLVASKLGFMDYNQPISFDDGQAEKAFTVTLDPKVAGVAVPYTPPAYTPPAYTPPAPPVHHDAPVAPEPPAVSHPAESSGGGGGQAYLNINSIPASSIILDGKPIGSTPKLKYAVSSGSHSVLFVNVDQNFKKQITVSVGAGETKAAIGRN
jgi:PEGA domain